jgi:hypothetical protein
MKIEENLGFDKALYIDNEVWKVLPKIQARFFQSISRLDNGIEALKSCFTEKLLLDGFTFCIETEKNSFRVNVTQCPWYDLLVKSGRANISRQIGDIICNTEYSGWAHEFGENISFELQQQICSGSRSCIMHFSES